MRGSGGGARAALAQLPTLLDLLNCFGHTSYAPPDRAARPFEYRLQLALTLLGIGLAVALIAEQLLSVAGRPVAFDAIAAAPSAADVAALFDQQAAGGSVSSLSCACTRATVALPLVTRWVAPEDSFCRELRQAAGRDGVLARLARDPANTACIGAPPGGAPGDDERARDEFAAAVEAAGRAAGLFPPAADSALYRQFARRWEAALCGLAFGTVPPAHPAAAAAAAGASDPSPPLHVSELANRCHGSSLAAGGGGGGGDAAAAASAEEETEEGGGRSASWRRPPRLRAPPRARRCRRCCRAAPCGC